MVIRWHANIAENTLMLIYHSTVCISATPGTYQLSANYCSTDSFLNLLLYRKSQGEPNGRKADFCGFHESSQQLPIMNKRHYYGSHTSQTPCIHNWSGYRLGGSKCLPDTKKQSSTKSCSSMAIARQNLNTKVSSPAGQMLCPKLTFKLPLMSYK